MNRKKLTTLFRNAVASLCAAWVVATPSGLALGKATMMPSAPTTSQSEASLAPALLVDEKANEAHSAMREFGCGCAIPTDGSEEFWADTSFASFVSRSMDKQKVYLACQVMNNLNAVYVTTEFTNGKTAIDAFQHHQWVGGVVCDRYDENKGGQNCQKVQKQTIPPNAAYSLQATLNRQCQGMISNIAQGYQTNYKRSFPIRTDRERQFVRDWNAATNAPIAK